MSDAVFPGEGSDPFEGQAFTLRPPEMFSRSTLDFPASGEEDNGSLELWTNPHFAFTNEESMFAIREVVTDRDPTFGSTRVTWLGCEDFEQALNYGNYVGWGKPAPAYGKESVVTTERKIFWNPYKLAELNNESAVEIKPDAVEKAVQSFVKRFGIDPDAPAVKKFMVEIIQDFATTTKKISAGGLSGERTDQYLDIMVREPRLSDTTNLVNTNLESTFNKAMALALGLKEKPEPPEYDDSILETARLLINLNNIPQEVRGTMLEVYHNLLTCSVALLRFKQFGIKQLASPGSQEDDERALGFGKKMDVLLESLHESITSGFESSLDNHFPKNQTDSA